MIASNMGSVPAEFPQEADTIAESGTQGPMSQQDAVALTAMRCIRRN
jgi:hypothetical protein